MFDKIMNYVREQRELDNEYMNMNEEQSILYSKWQNMLGLKDEIRIITGNTEAEVEKEYNQFRREMERMDPNYHCGHNSFLATKYLNHIYNVKEPEYLYEDHKLTIIIRYRYIGLREGFTKEEHDTIKAQYNEMGKKIKRFEQLHPRIYAKHNRCYDDDF